MSLRSSGPFDNLHVRLQRKPAWQLSGLTPNGLSLGWGVALDQGLRVRGFWAHTVQGFSDLKLPELIFLDGSLSALC